MCLLCDNKYRNRRSTLHLLYQLAYFPVSSLQPGVPSATTDAGCEDLLTRYLQRWSAGRAASGALSRVDLKFRGRSKLGEHLTTIDAAVKGEYNASAFFAEFDTAYQLRAQQEDEELECPD